MKKLSTLIAILSLLLSSCDSTKETRLEVSNPLDQQRNDARISLTREAISQWMEIPEGKVPLLSLENGEALPCQLDDLNQDAFPVLVEQLVNHAHQDLPPIPLPSTLRTHAERVDEHTAWVYVQPQHSNRLILQPPDDKALVVLPEPAHGRLPRLVIGDIPGSGPQADQRIHIPPVRLPQLEGLARGPALGECFAVQPHAVFQEVE